MKISLITVVLSGLTTGIWAAEVPLAQASDRQLNHQIHSAIVEDSTLPYCAHVVRVTCENGVVQLDGHVHTEAEKENVGQKAADFAGDDNVINNVAISKS